MILIFAPLAAFNNRDNLPMNFLWRPCCVDDVNSLAGAMSLLEKTLSHEFEIRGATAFEPVETALDALHGNVHGQIQYDGDVGTQTTRGNLSDLPDLFDIESPCTALIDDIGEQETIRNHAITLLESRSQLLCHQLSSAGHVEQHFGSSIEIDFHSMQEYLAQRLTEFRSARIAESGDRFSRFQKPIGQQLNLCRLAPAVQAIE